MNFKRTLFDQTTYPGSVCKEIFKRKIIYYRYCLEDKLMFERRTSIFQYRFVCQVFSERPTVVIVQKTNNSSLRHSNQQSKKDKLLILGLTNETTNPFLTTFKITRCQPSDVLNCSNKINWFVVLQYQFKQIYFVETLFL